MSVAGEDVSGKERKEVPDFQILDHSYLLMLSYERERK